MEPLMRLLSDNLPASAPSTVSPPIDHADYRRALGTFGTGVTVITTHWKDQDWGMTCNSFSSVSLQPRLVLWSIRREANSYEAFTRSGGFTVNVLAHAQQPLAHQFATGTLEQRFAGVALERLASQRVRLPGASAWFDCELHQLLEAGDHTIVLGRVTRFESNETHALSFWCSRFSRFDAPTE
jgi:flavin reductase (DIM6/NTAB) family NADH-FMN oxidoreductase RutF